VTTTTTTPDLSARLENATKELREVQDLLLSADLDSRILMGFRDAVNRVRNAAWVMEQYSESKANERDPGAVLSLLASERIRALYQLCKALQKDLGSTEIRFQTGQLMQLHDAAQDLVKQLSGILSQIGE